LDQEVFNTESFLAEYTPHPSNFLFLVTDRKDQDEPRKGFLWLQASPFDMTLRVLALSLDAEFRIKHPHFFNRRIKPLIIELARKAHLKIFWSRFNPVRDGLTHYGRLREYRIYSVDIREVQPCQV